MDDVVFNPSDYRRGFSNEQIVEHVVDCLRMVEEILEQTPELPVELQLAVFSTVQMMRSSMQAKHQLVQGTNGKVVAL